MPVAGNRLHKFPFVLYLFASKLRIFSILEQHRVARFSILKYGTHQFCGRCLGGRGEVTHRLIT
jgi:hypothetical protein